MRGRKKGEVCGGLLALRKRFESWRKSRSPGERIPDRLWDSATATAAEFGLARTARVLKLDYYSLKKRLSPEIRQTPAAPRFIELPALPVTATGECLIEFENQYGDCMRVRLQGTLPDLPALGRSFWNAD